MKNQKKFTTFLLLSAAVTLSACSNKVETEAKYPSGYERTITGEDIYSEKQSVFGDSGLSLFGKDKKNKEDTSGISVNSYLWRASLDTISFMPLASADPFGGVIITDWHSPPETPNERFKANVFIMSKSLRSDGVEVRVFRQKLEHGFWQDASASDDTAHKLEDTILTRARQLRVAQMDQ